MEIFDLLLEPDLDFLDFLNIKLGRVRSPHPAHSFVETWS